jgi:hypothetical protein
VAGPFECGNEHSVITKRGEFLDSLRTCQTSQEGLCSREVVVGLVQIMRIQHNLLGLSTESG